MKLYSLSNMIKGWFVGNFEPAVYKTSEFEVGVKAYLAGDREPRHHHKIGTEITVIVSGEVRMNDVTYGDGSILVILPGEDTDFLAIKDSKTVVVKFPSVANDKFLGKSI